MFYYAIFIPSNEVSTPSLQYSPQGQLSEDEADELRRQLIGSSANVIQFDDAEQYIAHLEEIDEEFFAEHCDEMLDEMVDQAGGWL